MPANCIILLDRSGVMPSDLRIRNYCLGVSIQWVAGPVGSGKAEVVEASHVSEDGMNSHENASLTSIDRKWLPQAVPDKQTPEAAVQIGGVWPADGIQMDCPVSRPLSAVDARARHRAPFRTPHVRTLRENLFVFFALHSPFFSGVGASRNPGAVQLNERIICN